MTIAQLFFSFQGRIGRLTYFLAFLALNIVQVILLSLAFKSPAPLSLVFALALLGTVPSGLSLTVKRLHDLDKSGWYVALIVVQSLATALLKSLQAAEALAPALILSVIVLALTLWMLWIFVIQVLFFRGTSGTNSFGNPSNPLEGMFGNEGEEADLPATHGFDAPAQPLAQVVNRLPATPPMRTRPAMATSVPAFGSPQGFGRRR